MALRAATILGERYRVVRELGHGGFGEVYLVEHVKLGTRLAAKVLSGPSMRDPHVRAQFQEEAKTAAGVAGRHVVKVQDVGEDPEHGPFFIMEFLEGRSLLDELRAQPEGYLSHSAVRGVFAQLRRALGKAHKQGVVHRDLKPENVFLARDEDDDEAVVKLLDFGLAKVLHEHASADLSRAMGTPTFAAPEQLRSQSGKVNTYTDVWALGLLAYLCLTGKHYWRSANTARPRAGDVLSEVLVDALEAASARAAEQGVRERLPQGFDAWFARCVDRDGGRRFAQAEACIDGLLAALGAPVAEARPSTPGPVSMRTGEGFASMDFGASQPPVSPPSIAPKPPQSSGTSTSPGVTEAVSEALDTAVVAKPKRGAVGVMAAGAAAMLVVGGYAFSRPSRGVLQPGSTVATIAAPSIPSTPAPVQPGPAPVQPAQAAPGATSNPWVEIAPSPHPVTLGVANERAPEAVRGFRPRKRIESPGAAYEIQRREVRWGELDPWLAAHPEHRVVRPNWAAPEAADRADMPAAGVPWDVARAYCRSLGGDLPTEEQWEFAARGATRRPYPWGDAPVDLSRTWGFRGAAGPGPVGTASQDVTEGTGLQDMLGNVREWTRDLWREDLPAQDESWVQNAQGEVYRAVRGLPLAAGRPSAMPAEGAAWREPICAAGPCARRAEVQREVASIGFRCVR